MRESPHRDRPSTVGRLRWSGARALLAALVLGVASRAQAQTAPGSVTGKVTDASGGAAIAGSPLGLVRALRKRGYHVEKASFLRGW